MRVLLDTNAYVALKRGHEGIARRVRAATRLYWSSVVVGELLYGFRYGTRYARNRAELDEILSAPLSTTVDVSLETADRYGRIAAALRRAGTPIPVNDVWIAAHALETGAQLVTFDAHFEAVPGLLFDDPDQL